MSNNNHILADEHIGRLLFKLSLPAMTGMVVQALYNVVDTIFVGRVVGPLGIAGITIVFPIQMIVMAVAIMVGVGGASIISRALGANDLTRANKTLGNILSIIIILGFSVAILGNIFLKQLLFIFGTTATILPFASDYASIILFGTIFFSFAMTTNSIVRAEGRATIAMTTMLISAVLNIILDAIFILGFHWGIKGAAWATVLSQAVTVVYLVYYFLSGRSSLKIIPAFFRLDRKLAREIMAIGSSAFVRQVSGSFIAVIVNHSLKHYGSDLAIAVYGIINRTISFVSMPMFGIAQGAQPIIGYNYGARRYDKTRRALNLAVEWTTAFSTIGFLLLMLFPRQATSLFTNSPDLIAWGAHSMRLFILMLPTLGFQVIGGTLFQSLGLARKALYLTIARQLVVIPLILSLPPLLQLDGIWISFPIADFIFFIVTWKMYQPQIQRLKQLSGNLESAVAAKVSV